MSYRAGQGIVQMDVNALVNKFKQKDATIGIVGLGYVGLPLMLQFSASGFNVIGFDISKEKVEKLQSGQSYICHIAADKIKTARENGFEATVDYARINEVDAIIICVPTPLSKHRDPDMSYINETMTQMVPNLREHQVISLESTIYPGSTNEYLRPAIESRGFVLGKNFYLVYSPEREDPGNRDFEVKSIPKLVGGETAECLQVGISVYEQVIQQVVPVSSTQIAEFAKLLENIHRAVNIGLVNEMKVVADKMGIDIFEVIDAAATKPFGFVPYYPGPGIGGHCIPIDPYYLTWKAREFGLHTRFIELSGEVNDAMPEFVVGKLTAALNDKAKALHGSDVLVIGLAYKPDVDDLRGSPSLRIIDLLQSKGSNIYYSDRNIRTMPRLLNGSVDLNHSELTADLIAKMDAVVISTNNSDVDYELLLKHATLIIDTRGVYRGAHSNVIRA
jgi:UDP-N-acetyl-D-glucosamine dehydrogenase